MDNRDSGYYSTNVIASKTKCCFTYLHNIIRNSYILYGNCMPIILHVHTCSYVAN